MQNVSNVPVTVVGSFGEYPFGLSVIGKQRY